MSKLALSAITVCLAAEGYPENPQKGEPIWGLGQKRNEVDFQLAAVSGDHKTTGGRVMYATAVANTLGEAAAAAYDAIDLSQDGPTSNKVGFKGMQIRHDIGHQAR